jgi:NADH-quinone oxidoreductase subunit N
VACLLLLAGLSFRVTAVPFHFYAPDVFQGVNASAAAMLSVVPKIVGFVALLRLVPLASAGTGVLPSESLDELQWLLAVIAVVTMFAGNLLALRQKHLHRLLAYSSIAHAGYMLAAFAVGMASPNAEAIGALLFYLLAYAIMTLGVFAVISACGTRTRPLATDADLAGLSSNHPAAALLMAVCLFSLTGLPPTGGFLGKFNLFVAAWSDGSDLARILAGALALNAAIAAWYYLRLVAVMYLEPAARPRTSSGDWPAWVSAVGCAAATVLLFALPQAPWDAAQRATRPLSSSPQAVTVGPEVGSFPLVVGDGDSDD